jgi:stage II sporulation protein M
MKLSSHPTQPLLTPRAVAGRYWTLFGSTRRWLLVAVIIFVGSVLGGLVSAWFNPAQNIELLRQVAQEMAPMLALLREGDTLRAIGAIFWHNLSSILLLLGMGALVWPLLVGLPVLAFGGNGYLLGVVLALSDQSAARTAGALVPHAIFELPALIIAAAWSLKLSLAWLLPAAAGRRGDVWRATVIEALWVIPLLALLLLIAAVVEVTVSGPLAGSL